MTALIWVFMSECTATHDSTDLGFHVWMYCDTW